MPNQTYPVLQTGISDPASFFSSTDLAGIVNSRIDRSVPNGARVAVTLEQGRGGDQPSGPTVLSGSPI